MSKLLEALQYVRNSIELDMWRIASCSCHSLRKIHLRIESLLENKLFTENYPDPQVDSQQELRIRICCTLSINIVNACFDHHYSTAVLQTEV